MPKNILIVESDAQAAQAVRTALVAKGFTVEETFDGKGSIERVRQLRPELVVLAVELSAGQNGYILCGKLKKDDELKSIPIIIVGPPEGFAQHRKLKTRADDYEAKPLDVDALVEKIGMLVGFPEPATASGSTLDELLKGEPQTGEFSSEEVSLESVESAVQADPSLDMLDAAFEGMTQPPPPPPAAKAPAHNVAPSSDDDEPRTVIGSAASLGLGLGLGATVDPRVAELEQALADAEARIQGLETQLAERAASGKSDKEFFALRESVNKKDKEILKLRAEYNQKDEEIVELKDREVKLEQRLAEVEAELSKRDVQVKSATQKAESAAAADRKRQEQVALLQRELEGLRARVSEVELERDAGRNELDNQGAQLQRIKAELDEAYAASETAQAEADTLKAQLTSQATAFAEEMSSLRRRLGDSEETAKTHEHRAGELASELQEERKLREKARQALGLALDVLEDQPSKDRTGRDRGSLSA